MSMTINLTIALDCFKAMLVIVGGQIVVGKDKLGEKQENVV